MKKSLSSPELMSVRDLSFSYQDRPGDTVLSHLDLEIFEGECLAVLGASGSGKTTLLKLLCGLLKPDSGKICYRGQALRGPQREIAMIFQNYGLFPWKTVRENVILPLRLRGEHIDRQKTDSLLEYLGILPHAEKYPGELSGGQRQRTALGRAVMADARLILMDEPFSALDIRNREKLRRFMLRLFDDMHMTSILVTHSIEEALCMGDRIAVFDEERGRIREIFSNSPGTLETDSEDYYRLFSKVRGCL